jgi:hypothetical protein
MKWTEIPTPSWTRTVAALATLSCVPGQPVIVSTTTTVKLAERMVAASRVVEANMPVSLSPPLPINVLLEIYLAEEAGRSIRVHDLTTAGSGSTMSSQRWVSALSSSGLVEQRGELIALSQLGYDTIMKTLKDLFMAQRELD